MVEENSSPTVTVLNLRDGQPGSTRSFPLPRRAVWLAVPLLALLAILLSGGTFRLGEVTVDGRPLGSTTPAVSQRSPEVRIRFAGWAAAGVVLRVDEAPVDLRVQWFGGRATGSLPALPDGPHRLDLDAGGVSHSWTFRVDTRPPRVTVEAPRDGFRTAAETCMVAGRTEPGARVEVRDAEGVHSARADGQGRFSLEVPLHQGLQALRWEVRDEAGNLAEGTREVLCDRTPPTIRLLAPEPGGVTKSRTPSLKFEVSDPESGLERVTVAKKGGKEVSLPLPAGPDGPLTFPAGFLTEGRHEFLVEARNGVGGVQRSPLEIVVDSTEVFGEGILGLGARGKDVEELQARLRREGFLREPEPSGTFGQATLRAVKAFQESLGLKPDGLAGPYTIGALSSRIYVNLSRFSLVLEEPSGSLHSYPVAHGMPEFATPAGRYYVIDKEKNPTWFPPDSVWAREAKATPPGPGNPLGTRWVGLSAGGLGIHGTPAEWTIGSRASHGCIRMTVRDVEDLYERVEPGTRVVIFAGDEKDPDRERLWPSPKPEGESS